jgi:hypothetical protein
MRSAGLTLLLATVAVAQQGPDLAAQKAAMQKLSFLVGTWTGEGTSTMQSGAVKFQQTESVQYKLDGLVMTIEGAGRNSAGEVAFRAFATVAYDDASRTYHFRAYNDGRYLDTPLKVLDRGFEWGYQAGPANVKFTMRLTDKGEWSETGEVVVGNAPPRKILEMVVHK